MNAYTTDGKELESPARDSEASEQYPFTDISCLHCGDRTHFITKDDVRHVTCFKCGWLEPRPCIDDLLTQNTDFINGQRAVRATDMPRSPLDDDPGTEPIRKAPHKILFLEHHAEIIIGQHRAIVDFDDLEKVRWMKWQKHNRGPINVIQISRKPRRNKNTLMAQLLYGKPTSFINGNRYDLRRHNVFFSRLCNCGTRGGLGKGVFFRHNSWIAQTRWNGKTQRRQFGVNVYGAEEAKRLAIVARQAMITMANQAVIAKSKKLYELPKQINKNQKKASPLETEQALVEFARRYSACRHLPEDMLEHLVAMLKIGGGRLPRIEVRKNLAPVNIYEGNAEYQNCEIEIPFVDGEAKWDGFNIQGSVNPR